jgi:hypothetical protein
VREKKQGEVIYCMLRYSNLSGALHCSESLLDFTAGDMTLGRNRTCVLFCILKQSIKQRLKAKIGKIGCDVM